MTLTTKKEKELIKLPARLTLKINSQLGLVVYPFLKSLYN